MKHFARLEYLMQAIMAAVTEYDDTKIIILTNSLSYSQKRDTLYSFFKLYPLQNKEHDATIRDFLDQAHKHSALRNNIAHALWREGTRPDTIKAGYIDVRHGRGKVAGYADDDKDCTIDNWATQQTICGEL